MTTVIVCDGCGQETGPPTGSKRARYEIRELGYAWADEPKLTLHFHNLACADLWLQRKLEAREAEQS